MTRSWLNSPIYISIFLFISFVLLVGLSLNESPIVTRGEGREAQVIQAIERNGDLILPLRNGTTVPSKPPLFHWISYSVSKLTGQLGEFEIRSASTLAGAVLISSAFLFLIKNAIPAIALTSFAILISSLEFIRYSTQARVDMVFAAGFSMSIFMLLTLIKQRPLLSNRFKIFAINFLCVISLATSVIAKGPFGLVIPGFILFVFIVLTKQLKNYRLLVNLSLIFCSAILISGLWYLLAYLKLGDSFLEVQLFKENLARVVKDENKELGHEKPFFYSLIYLSQVFIPWTLFVPRLFYSFSINSFREKLRYNSFFLLCLIWATTFLIAVTLSVSKRSVYFLPAVVPFSYLIAVVFNMGREKTIPKGIRIYEKSILLLLLTGLGLLTLLGAIVQFHPTILENFTKVPKFTLIETLFTNPIFIPSLLVSFIFIKYAYDELNGGRFDNFIYKFSFSTFFIFLVFQHGLIPSILNLESPKDFASVASKIVPLSADFRQYDDEFYAPVFYIDREVKIADKSELPKLRISKSYLLIKEGDLKIFDDENVGYDVLLKSRTNIANRHQKLYLIKLIS